jgi:hypothetical protein
MSFFNSEFVQREISEVNKLRNKITESIESFSTLSVSAKKEKIDFLSELLNKQRLIYTRVSLSQEPEAIQLKDELNRAALKLGDESAFHSFEKVQYLIDQMKLQIYDKQDNKESD